MLARKDRLFCAIDTGSTSQASALVGDLKDAIGGIKLGLEFFVANGPIGIRKILSGADLPLFLDLKLHDIPNTVSGAVQSAVQALSPQFLTLQASGGAAMMRAARDAARQAAGGKASTKLLAVTVLTSLDSIALEQVGQGSSTSAQVERLARLAMDSGMDGIVCSPAEVGHLRRALGPHAILVTPGIRPQGSQIGDQKRVATPQSAVAAGADYLVVGRPITQAADPVAAAHAIAAEIGG